MAKAKLDVGTEATEGRVRLVRAAFKLSGCYEWVSAKEAHKVTSNPDNLGWTAEGIQELAREWMVTRAIPIEERVEDREPYKQWRDFYYFIRIPLAGFPRGLFVEMELISPDEEMPEVSLLNAHPAEVGSKLPVPQ